MLTDPDTNEWRFAFSAFIDINWFIEQAMGTGSWTMRGSTIGIYMLTGRPADSELSSPFPMAIIFLKGSFTKQKLCYITGFINAKR